MPQRLFGVWSSGSWKSYLPVGGRLPDVEDGARDGLVGGHVADHAVHEGDAAAGGDGGRRRSTTMEAPFGREGAEGDQKGPRMEEEVGSMSPSEMILWAISLTRLDSGSDLARG